MRCMSDMSVFVAPGLPIDVSPGSPLHPFGFAESVLRVLILLLALILFLGIIIVWGTGALSSSPEASSSSPLAGLRCHFFSFDLPH